MDEWTGFYERLFNFHEIGCSISTTFPRTAISGPRANSRTKLSIVTRSS
jgi:hypothetical protein